MDVCVRPAAVRGRANSAGEINTNTSDLMPATEY